MRCVPHWASPGGSSPINSFHPFNSSFENTLNLFQLVGSILISPIIWSAWIPLPEAAAALCWRFIISPKLFDFQTRPRVPSFSRCRFLSLLRSLSLPRIISTHCLYIYLSLSSPPETLSHLEDGTRNVIKYASSVEASLGVL